jgi:hypothetical protein
VELTSEPGLELATGGAPHAATRPSTVRATMNFLI